MATKLPFTCQNCGTQGTVDLDKEMSSIDAANISITNPCPSCNAKLSAPGGKYEKNDDGVLVRVGDHTSTKLPVTCANCGLTGTLDMAMNLGSMDSASITIKNPCPSCQGELTAPGGKYERDSEGLLVRVGDATAPQR